MKEKLMMACLMVYAGIAESIEKLTSDERGASDMVAVIVLIVIIIAAALIFRTQLIGAVNAIFQQLTDFIGG